MLSALLALTSAAHATGRDALLEEVVVTATLREQPLSSAPASITVLDEQMLRDAGRQHFEDVLTAVPNLHWAGGTSRPRYFQLRGIGEREQYEGAPNPSLGFLIDDIDFSGIGLPATLFDVERVEILRGPQGMRYGANALAGLIAMRGRDPADEFGLSSEASWGEYASQSLAAVVTGPLERLHSAWRLAVQRYRSDGFRRNAFLGRDDTSARDELTARAKWRWQPGAGTRVDLTWLYADIDNGYDGWSIDNSRRSLVDDPGKDAQRSNGFSLRAQSAVGAAASLTAIVTAANSRLEHSFDGDWGNAQSWAPFTYDFFYRALRQRHTRSFEVRLASQQDGGSALPQWLVGAYALRLTETLGERSTGVYAEADFESVTDDFLRSRYAATNLAWFGQLEGSFARDWSWSLGTRVEQRVADYADRGMQAGELRSSNESDDERMWGGQATLSYASSARHSLYATLARSYKAGGFNLGSGALAQQGFAGERLTSLESGLKSRWQRVHWDVSAFYMRRADPQVRTGDQLEPGDPNSFVFFTTNAEHSTSYGLESSVRWQLSPALELGNSVGLLRTQLRGYFYQGAAVPAREQAHAPQYQVCLNATWRHPRGWMARLDVAAVDDYYFDVPPNPTRSDAYALTHLKLGYEAQHWSVYAWSRNLLDEQYVVRGFYFGNEPPLFAAERYTQLGEPRQFGITARWEFKP